MFTTDVATYRLQSHQDEFSTGILQDGKQAIVIPISTSQFACLLFDAAGMFIGAEEIPNDSKEIWLQPKTIVVQDFSIREMGIAIRHYPQVFDEFLTDPDAVEPEVRYRERTAQQIR